MRNLVRILGNLVRLWESSNLNMYMYMCLCLYLVPIPYDSKSTTSRSTTAAITTTIATNIFLGQIRQWKSNPSPLPAGREAPLRTSRLAFRRVLWHKQAEQHLAMAVHEAPSRDEAAPVAG